MEGAETLGLFFLVDKLILLWELLLLPVRLPPRPTTPPPPPPPPPLFKARDILFFFLGLLDSEWLVPEWKRELTLSTAYNFIQQTPFSVTHYILTGFGWGRVGGWDVRGVFPLQAAHQGLSIWNVKAVVLHHSICVRQQRPIRGNPNSHTVRLAKVSTTFLYWFWFE